MSNLSGAPNNQRSLRSDNNAGVCPEAASAIMDCAQGHAVGYGDDEFTSRAVGAVRTFTSDRAEVFFLATGTAANTLAVAALTEPWQTVLCHHESHWAEDESTAPERFTGCRTVTVHPADGSSKITPDDLRAAAGTSRGDVHQPAPGAVTVSSATEFGAVYTPDELRALADTAHELGRVLHLDGARLANAVARVAQQTGGTPAAVCRAMTGGAGVDAVSFGGTKAGMALGEAVVFIPNHFNQQDGRFERAVRAFPYLRKGTGHLLSKHRIVSAQFAAMLDTDANGACPWTAHATHANAMAARLAEGLRRLGYPIDHPAEANAVFVTLTKSQHEGLTSRGHGYYLFGPQQNHLARLMCSFDTAAEDIESFLRDAADLR